MDLPDESQWDETTCDMAVCQHPQCWATIRRIERGHPRILCSRCRIPLDVDDKLPVVTVVNISGSCFRAKRRPHRHLPGFTFTKPHSLLSQGSKFDSRFQGRPWKKLPGKDLINRTDRSFKLPVLNLNETPLPCPQDVRNMVVVWIPKEPEDHVGPAEKHIVPSQDGRKKRKTPTGKDKSPLVLSGKQDLEARLRAPGIIVPPPSPVHFFEQLNSELPPFWNQSDTLPRYLLNDLLSDEERTSPCLEMKTQLAMMKKKPPLENSRPDSAISAKMFLSVRRLTLQRPALKYPEHLKRLYYNLKEENGFSGTARSPGDRKQQWPQERQQQRTLKMPTKNQEAKKKSKSDPESHSTSHKHLGAMVCAPCYGPTLEKAEQFEDDEQIPVTEGKTPEGPLVDEAGEVRGPSLKPQESSKKAESAPPPLPQVNLCSLRLRSTHNLAPSRRTLPGQESDTQQQQQMKENGPALQQDSTERPQRDHAENYLGSSPSEQSSESSRTESSDEDISTEIGVVPKEQKRTSKDLSASSTSRQSWNPELKLLRILQSTDDEDEEKELSGEQREESPEAEAEVVAGQPYPQQGA